MTLIEGYILVSFAGPPTTGVWNAGSAILDTTGTPFICQVSGTPGQWAQVLIGGAVDMLSIYWR